MPSETTTSHSEEPVSKKKPSKKSVLAPHNQTVTFIHDLAVLKRQAALRAKKMRGDPNEISHAEGRAEGLREAFDLLGDAVRRRSLEERLTALTLEDRILRLEDGPAPGTSLSRVLSTRQKDGTFEPSLGWVLSTGALHERKMFFYANTIEGAVWAAESHIRSLKRQKE